MNTIKITPNLPFEYQCTSGKFIRLPNRIESNRNFFCPNWNALPMSSKLMQENLRLSDGTVQDSATTATKTQDTVLLYSSQ